MERGPKRPRGIVIDLTGGDGEERFRILFFSRATLFLVFLLPRCSHLLTCSVDLTVAEIEAQKERDMQLYGHNDVDEEENANENARTLLDDGKGLMDLDQMQEASQPKTMRTKLFPFQLQGLFWMQKRDSGSDGKSLVKGGILGDEMGLGKTLQSIGLILSCPPSAEERKNLRHLTLVLAPLSCIQQWKDELQLHSPTLKVLIYHGSKARKKPITALLEYDVLLSTYGTVGMAVLDNHGQVNYSDPLLKIRLFRLILDEGHMIRNPTTRAHKACMILKANRRWVLSGTPIQNRSSDICALLRFLNVDRLRKEWPRRKKNVKKLTLEWSRNASGCRVW